MHACPRCWEVIEQPTPFAEATVLYEHEPAPAPAPPAEQTAPVATTTLTYEEPVYHAPPVYYAPPPEAPSSAVRLGRTVVIGLIGAVLLVIAFLALEAWGPQLRGELPAQVRLQREAFPSLGFTVSVPGGWEVREETVEGRPAVVAREPEDEARPGEARSVEVVAEAGSLERARRLADERAAASVRNYDEIAIIDGLEVDGREAFRHLYTDGDLYREEWWVERGRRSYRLRFSAPVSRREESAPLFVRIARTLDVF